MLIERLEGRRLLSASISTSADGSVLMITNAASVIVTEFDVPGGKQVSITDNSLPAGSNGAILTGNFSTLVIQGTSGNDQILLNTFDLNTVIDAGNGDDLVQAFIESSDTVGGTAQVAIAGGNGADTIVVDGSTASQYTVQENGTFIVDGGNGQDTIQILDPINVQVLQSRGNDIVTGTPA